MPCRPTFTGIVGLGILLFGGVFYLQLHFLIRSKPVEDVSASDKLEMMRLQWVSYRNNISLRHSSNRLERPVSFNESSSDLSSSIRFPRLQHHREGTISPPRPMND